MDPSMLPVPRGHVSDTSPLVLSFITLQGNRGRGNKSEILKNLSLKDRTFTKRTLARRGLTLSTFTLLDLTLEKWSWLGPLCSWCSPLSPFSGYALNLKMSSLYTWLLFSSKILEKDPRWELSRWQLHSPPPRTKLELQLKSTWIAKWTLAEQKSYNKGCTEEVTSRLVGRAGMQKGLALLLPESQLQRFPLRSEGFQLHAGLPSPEHKSWEDAST